MVRLNGDMRMEVFIEESCQSLDKVGVTSKFVGIREMLASELETSTTTTRWIQSDIIHEASVHLVCHLWLLR